jgi:RNA polymerase sigma-70 factor, ECF subfamily
VASTEPHQPPNGLALAASEGALRASDLALVRRLVAGEAAAWREFVERYQRLILTRVLVAAREVNQPLAAADAEDHTAEVFAALVAGGFAMLRRFEGRSALSTWLCVVTRRMVLRKLIASRRDPARSAPAPSFEALAGPPQPGPLAALIGGEELDRLAAGMDQLGERQRQIARLFYFDGCSYREISQQLDMPVNSIGPTLARIQLRLRAALGEEDT